jgi:putative membrane protein
MKTILCLLAVILSGCGARAADGLNSQDLTFFRSAATNGRLQLRLGQLALQRAESQAVKDLATRMVADYNLISQELAALAQRNDVVLPPDDPSDLESQPIMQTKGAEFDKAYSVFVVNVCEISVGVYERESRTGADAETKAWAQKTLLVLQRHLEDAKGLPKPAKIASR